MGKTCGCPVVLNYLWKGCYWIGKSVTNQRSGVLLLLLLFICCCCFFMYFICKPSNSGRLSDHFISFTYFHMNVTSAHSDALEKHKTQWTVTFVMCHFPFFSLRNNLLIFRNIKTQARYFDIQIRLSKLLAKGNITCQYREACRIIIYLGREAANSCHKSKVDVFKNHVSFR